MTEEETPTPEPVVTLEIETITLTEDNFIEVAEWINAEQFQAHYKKVYTEETGTWSWIPTHVAFSVNYQTKSLKIGQEIARSKNAVSFMLMDR